MVASNGCMAKKLIAGFLGRDSRPQGMLGKRYSKVAEPKLVSMVWDMVSHVGIST